MFIKHRADIDGLRAIAVISVLLYHLQNSFLPGGFIGVDVFFVISGFVVTSSLSQNQSASFWSFIARFYARRLARIMPALLTMLLVTILADSLLIPQAWLSQLSQETARYAFFGLSNWKLETNLDSYFAPRAEYNPYTHTWSLGVEEQFYLIVPVIIYFWIKVRASQQGIVQSKAVILLAALTVFSFVICMWSANAQPAFAFYSIITRFWELGVGSLLFLLTSSSGSFKAPIQSVGVNYVYRVSALIGLTLISAGFIFTNANHFPWPLALLPVIGTLLLIGGAQLNPIDPIRQCLGSSALVWIGKRSYSLYLWHWPIYVLLRWTCGLNTPIQYGAALLLSLILSMLSYRFIEQPLRHNAWIEKHQTTHILLGYIGITLISCGLGILIFQYQSHLSLTQSSIQRIHWYANGLSHYPGGTAYDCLPHRESSNSHGVKLLQFEPKLKCSLNGLSSQRIFVIGDSHAEALFPLFEELSSKSATPVYLYANSGCSFLPLDIPMKYKSSPDCDIYGVAERITEQVITKAKPGDIIVLPSLRLPRLTDQSENITQATPSVTSLNDQMRLRLDASSEAAVWLKRFTDAKLHVVFIAPPPVLKSPPFRCIDSFNQFNPVCANGLSISKQELAVLRGPVLRQMQELSNQIPNVSLWDPFDTLCPGEQCAALKDGYPLFFDGDHLSNYGNWVLYQNFFDYLTTLHLLAK